MKIQPRKTHADVPLLLTAALRISSADTHYRGQIFGRKVLRVFLLAILSHLYSFALRFLIIQTHATSYSFYSVLLYIVKVKGENLIENHTPFPIV